MKETQKHFSVDLPHLIIRNLATTNTFEFWETKYWVRGLAYVLQAVIYLFKVNNENITTMCETYAKLTIQTPELHQCYCSGAFIVNFEHIWHLFLMLSDFEQVQFARYYVAKIVVC